MLTNTEKNIAIGAAIGIVSAMASAKISALGGDTDNGKLSQNARVIASTLLGTDIPETDDAVLGLVKALGEEQLLAEMTFADVVTAIEDSNEIHSRTVAEAVAEAEESVSPDIVSLNHIDKRTEELIAVTAGWQEMDYEHKRMVASIPRPKFADALAEAHDNGVKMGYYAPDGGISENYIEKLRQQLRDEKEQAEREEEEAALRAELDDEDFVDGEGDTASDNHTDTFFTDLAEKISSPMGDEVGERETGEFEAVRGAHAAVPDLSRIPEIVPSDSRTAAEPVYVEESELEGNFEIDDIDDEFSAQSTQEFPSVAIPSDEVLEILEPEPVKDPTGPIVMDPNDVVEAIVEEAADSADIVDDEVVAGMVESMAEEMLEAAELDPEECKSFTDSFMAVEIGEDGHARPKSSNAEKGAADDEEQAFASLYDVDGDAKTASDIQEGAEEILGIAAKTREAIKKAMKEPK